MSQEKQLRESVFAAVKAYCDHQHDFGFQEDDPVVRLHEPTFSTDEINAALECMLTTQVTMGKKVKAFEREFAASSDWKHAVMNNSGSSANLLAVAALTSPMAEDRLNPGDEVIVPALSWSTTVWPLIQCNLVPVIVDIDPETLNIAPDEIERAIGPKTRGIMPVHVYGNPCDMDALADLCERHNLTLIEDCCEALGASYDGKTVGRFGKVGTFSFYYSHHMTTLEGGICVTDDTEFAENMRILRAHGWVREVDDRQRWLDKYPDVDERFLFVGAGYNLRATELQGAMGSVQLPKLNGFVDTRRENAAWFRRELSQLEDFFEFQQETQKGRHSFFGFPMKVSENAPFSVDDLRQALESKNIETRPIICGNIALQPAMKLYEHRVVGDLTHATNVMKRGFSFGNHQAIDSGAREYVVENVVNFVREKS